MGAVVDFADESKNRIRVKNNVELAISLGKSRFDTNWKNGSMKWSVLLDKLSKSVTTPETHAEYMKMGKEAQDKIKDIGGFVGGHLKEGKRRNGNVECRQLVTLDADAPKGDLWDSIQNDIEHSDLICAMCIYSTHKHCSDKPRYRILIPLDRPVSADEYEAIARMLADHIGMANFDATTFQPTRLMYWPSNSSDVDPLFEYRDLPILKADDVLAEYPGGNWNDVSYWPEPDGMTTKRKKEADKQGDPLEKKGLVGAFCRTYTIQEAIAAFLPDVYDSTAKEDRYTYKAGSTAAGLVIYEDKFAFSNHGTDPASGQLCNAFDLVRIHKFGLKDEDAPPEKTGTALPSYKAMIEFVQNDGNVKRTIADDRRKEYEEDFGGSIETDNWKEMLEYNGKGRLIANVKNCLLIMSNDPSLKCITYNEMSKCFEIRVKEGGEDLPWYHPDQYWRDMDYSLLFGYLATQYDVEFTDKLIYAALCDVATKRGYHPIRTFIEELPEWDGVERVEGLLIRILGAPDTEYVRQVTRKSLVACIKRAKHPGCKFDTMLVLDGKPGIGKSTLLHKLGGQWFSDSLSMIDTRDKTAAEKLQGVWIMEIGEMQGTRKADVDIIKGFLSRQVDEYRPAFGRVVERRPRTTVIFGTTNTMDGFLRDTTGNRRFWPVTVSGGEGPWKLTDEDIKQIWAEVKYMEENGEDVYLDYKMEVESERMQREALERDEREGMVIDYLETLLPEDWRDWDLGKRMDYFSDDELIKRDGFVVREYVSSMEIFCECFRKPRSAWTKKDGYEIASIMARIEGWERSNAMIRDKAYGRQRIFTRTSVEQEG